MKKNKLFKKNWFLSLGKLKFQNLEFVLKNKMKMSILGESSFTSIIKYSLYNDSS